MVPGQRGSYYRQRAPDLRLVPLWATVGRGGRPEGFDPVAGTHFRFVAKPVRPFWDGIVECEVLEVDPPRRLRYRWIGDEGKQPSTVTCTLDAAGNATLLTWDHAGFIGVPPAPVRQTPWWTS